MKNILFLCSRNKLRSPTAQDLFAEVSGVETDSAGLSPDALVPLSVEHLEWADLILVMESRHRARLTQQYGKHLRGKQMAVLNIPDNYDYMQKELVELLQKKCRPYFPA